MVSGGVLGGVHEWAQAGKTSINGRVTHLCSVDDTVPTSLLQYDQP